MLQPSETSMTSQCQSYAWAVRESDSKEGEESDKNIAFVPINYLEGMQTPNTEKSAPSSHLHTVNVHIWQCYKAHQMVH